MTRSIIRTSRKYPHFAEYSRISRAGMKLPVEENSINHCEGREETRRKLARMDRNCANVRVLSAKIYTSYIYTRGGSLFTLKGKGKNRPPVCPSILRWPLPEPDRSHSKYIEVNCNLVPNPTRGYPMLET